MICHFAESSDPDIRCAATRVHHAIARGERVSSDPDVVDCPACKALLLGEGSITPDEHLRKIGAPA